MKMLMLNTDHDASPTHKTPAPQDREWARVTWEEGAIIVVIGALMGLVAGLVPFVI